MANREPKSSPVTGPAPGRMTLLGAARVNAVRAVVLWAMRLIAAWAVLYGAFLIGGRLVWATLNVVGNVGRSFFEQLPVYASGVGQDHGIVRGVPMIVVGVVLAACSRRLVRWVIAAPDTDCPRCAFSGPGADGRCPECGLPWGMPEADSSHNTD